MICDGLTFPNTIEVVPEINGFWKKKVRIEFITESNMVGDGQSVGITIKMQRLVNDIAPISYGAVLKEYIETENLANGTRAKSLNVICKKEIKLLRHLSQKDINMLLAGNFGRKSEHRLNITIPKAYKEVQFDAANSFVKIFHTIEIYVKLVDTYYNTKTFSSTRLIKIMPKESLMFFENLPSYENDTHSILWESPPAYSNQNPFDDEAEPERTKASA
ncbi:hypothetical protein AX774_g1993 [Zancudomyces culisetae]|uniref:Arrestin-like N-terminal domain-containing protein n=1 Tax=Zancudomyces culisetae TaxID=1213189 RepID=A0A1R1PU78_ZANCU|nr:hypothetical protein AX774_g1993 [Zancudomyces culisetae]|eukprot:OMH84473.1 hypothetical protein AX774_g1993 [Zancudomyces culisetae]